MFAREPLPQFVARRIQAMILSGELKPGDRVPSQRAFSDTLSVSRASLREALLTLETLGLVKTEPGRGTFVADARPSASRDMAKWRYDGRHTVTDVFETRIMLEGRIAAKVAGVIEAVDCERLSAATERMEQTFAGGDLLSNVEADLEFHGLIASLCPNRMLVDIYLSVRGQLTETQRQPIPKTAPERMAQSIAEHREIIDSLRQNDADRASAAMRAHVRNTARCAGVTVD